MSGQNSDELNIEQFAERLGMTTRTVRFYTGRGLIPPPRREGRNGWYGPEHVARLELVRELQAHGFTLQAIEGYLERIPADATPAQVALHRSLIAPWQAELPETISRTELEKRAGRPLRDDDLETLAALGIIDPTPTDDTYLLAPAHLAIGMEMLDIGMSNSAALRSRQIYEKYGRQLAQEMTDFFQTELWPQWKATDRTPEELQNIVERFKPISIAAFITSYESAVDELKRDTIRRRS